MAQGQKKPVSPPNEPEKSAENNDHFFFHGNSVKADTAKGKEGLELIGSAYVINGDTRIDADNVTLNGKDYRYAHAQGHIHIHDSKNNIDITANDLIYDRDNNISEIVGYSVLESPNDNMAIRSNYLKYMGKEKILVTQINVSITKQDSDGDLVAKGEYASFNQNTKVLIMSGNSVVYWKDNTYKAQHITINTDTNKIALTGAVNGTVITQNDDSSSNSSGTAGADSSGGDSSGADSNNQDSKGNK